jgi:hypothetical protein
MCGLFLFGSYWWIFPLAGMLICLTFLIVMSRFAGTGGGFMCMGGQQRERKQQRVETPE